MTNFSLLRKSQLLSSPDRGPVSCFLLDGRNTGLSYRDALAAAQAEQDRARELASFSCQTTLCTDKRDENHRIGAIGSRVGQNLETARFCKEARGINMTMGHLNWSQVTYIKRSVVQISGISFGQNLITIKLPRSSYSNLRYVLRYYTCEKLCCVKTLLNLTLTGLMNSQMRRQLHIQKADPVLHFYF